LGGGWAGCCLANTLKNRFPDSDISIITAGNPEQSAGLLRTENYDGFSFDTGGSHVIFSKNSEILSSMLGHIKGNYVEHQRNSFINFDGLIVPYPFENGMYVLPPEKRTKLGFDIVKTIFEQKKGSDWKPRNLGQFLYSVFGKEATRLYFGPYNKKIWKRPLTELDSDWAYIPGRLPLPNLKDVIAGVAGIPTVGYAEQAKFYYPKNGGIKALYDSLRSEVEKKQVEIVYNETVTKIKKADNNWVINGKIRAKNVYNTIPVPSVVKAFDAPESVTRASEGLNYNHVLTVGVALDKPAPNQHWIYVPSNKIIFHRYSWISNYSEQNAPKGKSAILAEITVPSGQQFKEETVVQETIIGLEKLKVIDKKEVIFAKMWFNKFGYPVNTLGHRQKLEVISNYLDSVNVKSVGRWGSWEYWNMDKVYEATSRVL
jgi:protoporphyrinogen oxidase